MKKVVLLTGATGAIGSAIAEGIASQDDYKLVILCRNQSKAQGFIKKIKDKK